MKFGPLPLDAAEGAYLAHSVRIEGERRTAFRKGRRLSAEDVAALRAAGHDPVIAAKLDDGDVHEDEAAARLAAACAGAHLAPTAPFTGRCNLVADAHGLLVVDRARVDRINRIDEAITIATLTGFDEVGARQMAATIKIIPFAVPRAALDEAVAAAGDGAEPLARVHPYVPSRVTLIQTRIGGMKESILDRTVEMTRRRVEAADSALVGPDLRTPHEAGALAEAIAASLANAPDILLIAGASAIVDRRDVLPAAIERAGGRVLHFGMPVDPGNLLLLAEAETGGRTIPVLGLPGCARSPKLNGFDWVLQRLIARVPVTRDDIMAMGVGGLLTEIASRPQPRDKSVGDSEAAVGNAARDDADARRRAPHAPHIAAVILAAGRSTRMGPENKLLAELDGVVMVRRVAETVAASNAAEVVAVTGHEADAVAAALADLKLAVRHNPDYAEGLSTSLKVGLTGVSARSSSSATCRRCGLRRSTG